MTLGYRQVIFYFILFHFFFSHRLSLRRETYAEHASRRLVRPPAFEEGKYCFDVFGHNNDKRLAPARLWLRREQSRNKEKQHVLLGCILMNNYINASESFREFLRKAKKKKRTSIYEKHLLAFFPPQGKGLSA